MKPENDIQILSKWRSAVMGMAALLIYFFHEWIPLAVEPGAVHEVEGFVKRTGFCGVDMFLLLSGMGLTYAIHKTGILMYYWKRFKRVMIPFLLFGILVGLVDKWNAEQFFGNLSGANFYRTDIYSFLWFVPAIMTFYLLFPLYYYLFEKARSKGFFTLAVIGAWLLFSMLFAGVMREDLYGFTNRIPIFLMGVLIGWQCQNTEIRFGRAGWLGFAVLLGLGGYLSYQCNFKGLQILVPVSNCCMPNFLIAVSFCFLLAKGFDLLDRVPVISTGVIGFFRFFGVISLEFYCVQEWLGVKFSADLAERFGNGMADLLLFLIAVSAGTVLHFLTKGIVWLLDGAGKRKGKEEFANGKEE